MQFLPYLFRQDMFMDGMLYTSVGHNLANGLGTAWHPHFSKPTLDHFHEQLPLMFWLQAGFFKAFGSNMYVERFYCLLISLLNLLMLFLLWKQLIPPSRSKAGSMMEWLAVYFWMAMGSVHWAFQNNMQECTMGFFAMLSVYFQLKTVHENKHGGWLIAGAAALLAAGLCKGPQGLFPLVTIPAHWLVYRNYSFGAAFKNTLIVTALLIGAIAALLLDSDIRAAFSEYFNTRIVGTFQGNAHDNHDRFYLLGHLWDNLRLPLAITGLLLIILRFRVESWRPALFCFMLALAGTFPLLVTLEQRHFYLVTALPWFALGLAMLVAIPLAGWIERIRIGKILFIVLAAIAILPAIGTLSKTISLAGKPREDKEMLNDVSLIGPVAGKFSVIGIPPEMWNEWPLRCYLVRYYHIGLGQGAQPSGYFLCDSALISKVPQGYEKINLPTARYHLFSKTE